MTKSLAKLDKLNLQQRLFCHYLTQTGETFGNRTKSYAMAYDISLPEDDKGTAIMTSKEYKNCQAASSRMCTLPKITQEIERLMLEKLNNNSVDTRLSGILHNGKDVDSIQAIKIYNELNNRIVKRLDVNVAARPFESVSDEELLKMANGD